MTKIAGSESISQRYGSADPDSYLNVTDPQQCFNRWKAMEEVLPLSPCVITHLRYEKVISSLNTVDYILPGKPYYCG
jgi:hypothetical protein